MEAEIATTPAQRASASGRGVAARVLSLGAGTAVAGLLLVGAIAPLRPPDVAAMTPFPGIAMSEGQALDLVMAVDASAAGRDAYSAQAKPRAHTAPLAAIPDPGTAQAFAYSLVIGIGWDELEFSCLVALWQRESRWNHLSHNLSSGAYGIPQALPGEKMAAAGDDWQTNPETQIRWGVSYIIGRYGTPCGAWEHSESVGWY